MGKSYHKLNNFQTLFFSEWILKPVHPCTSWHRLCYGKFGWWAHWAANLPSTSFLPNKIYCAHLKPEIISYDVSLLMRMFMPIPLRLHWGPMPGRTKGVWNDCGTVHWTLWLLIRNTCPLRVGNIVLNMPTKSNLNLWNGKIPTPNTVILYAYPVRRMFSEKSSWTLA